MNTNIDLLRLQTTCPTLLEYFIGVHPAKAQGSSVHNHST